MSNVDINDLEAFEQVVVVSGETDVKAAEDFFVPALPDDGEHETVLTVQESKGVTLEFQKDKQTRQPDRKKPYVAANFAFQLDTPSGRPAFVFDNPNSIPMSGGQSRLEAVMTIVGDPIPDGLTYKELKEHVEISAAQSPRLIVVTEWQAQIKDKDGNYKTIKRGQRNFPKDPETGEVSPEFEFEGQTVRAVAKVARYKRA